MPGICPLHKLQPNGWDRFQQNGYKYLFCYNCTKYNLESVELKHILGNRDINVFPDLNPLLILILK